MGEPESAEGETSSVAQEGADLDRMTGKFVASTRGPRKQGREKKKSAKAKGKEKEKEDDRVNLDESMEIDAPP